MNNHNNRIAWVTGGGSGIGQALALELAKHGWRVAISGRMPAKLEETMAAAPGGTIYPYPLDVTDGTAVAEIASRIERDVGPLALAVFNAGAYETFAADAFDSARFEQHMRVNYLGVVNGIAAVLPVFKARCAGHIVITGSLSGYRGMPLAAAYGASKAALINLAEALKFDLDEMGIRISICNPGYVKTDLTAKNRFHMPLLMSAEEAGRRFYRGIEKGRFEIAFPRRLVWLMKLMRCLPYALYFPLMRRNAPR
jgi:NAD(P)-dependent dehydrogenase (short-subunit alcohol dehydrogenase family)